MSTFDCKQCGGTFDSLEMFPGSICLECYTPTGEREFRALLRSDDPAGNLARMWGA